MKSPRTTGIIDTPDILAQRIDDNSKHTNIESINFEYDVVIVGGGTAGCVLASRLSENPELRILMVEAGGSSRDVLMSQIPAVFPKLFGSQNDYGLFTEPQPFAQDARKYWPRAKALGGCSTMNAMIFHSGAPSDFDEWSKTGLDGAEEWSYQALRKYFLKFEKYNPDPDYPGVDPNERGRDGPVNVGHFGYLTEASKKLFQACVNLGIPLNPDVNSPTRGTLGVTKFFTWNVYWLSVTYIDKTKTRVTAESSYLTPDVLQRPNLFTAVYSTATRIIFDGKDGQKHAIGLDFAHKNGNVTTTYRVRVKKELILAAGAVHSPHLLMISGVGPQNELEKHGIPVIHNLPGVGSNLQDHLVATIALSLKAGHSLQYLLGISLVDKVWSIIDLLRWKWFKSGSLTTNTVESAAFVRCDDSQLFEPDNYQIQDETSGSDAPDLEILMLPIGFAGIGLTGLCGNIPYPSMTFGAVGLRPQSRGKISLKSSNPFDPPIIDPHYLEKHNDVAVLVRGIRLMMKVVQTEPLASALEKHDHPLFDHDLHKSSDEELESEVRKRIFTLFHPTSTCRMAKLEDEGVVDARLKVHGLDNVRVVDASIFTRIPAGHTTAVVYAVAEKAADIIKQSLA
ncbi:hypothetical protein Clacol_004012 [Clathrus columnatus]|uniref:Glucose-methanol-choline oxidoreductase N-terminal domain-containing protein n=1 Tax=Clathrus columnatus TaxID=1419009 RepID=A0AAV5A9E1_9AGAM|nr:hypothetical protein Clacol_004012 [Clathrus columnatus]